MHQAFLHDSRKLTFTWDEREQHLEMRDGLPEPVKVGGYWEEPVKSYYFQKCQAGLYQSLHRIRPYIDREYDRHIFIYTNMPIEGVKVDHLLRDEESERIADRFERAVAVLSERLKEKGTCSVPELAEIIAMDGEDVLSVRRWIGQNGNGDKLAEATGSAFIAGKGKRPGRYARGT